MTACGPLNSPTLHTVAESENQWTGIGVTKKGRIFVNFPRWSDNVPVSVAEIINGKTIPFPDLEWNKPIEDDQHFVAVQSVFVDNLDRLWVLDTGNPQFRGVIERGPRLFRFNLTTKRLEKSFGFPKNTYSENSYLNDVRIDTQRKFAYITDSGTGGILTVDLSNGQVKRHLSGHPSVLAETDSLVFEDKTVWKNRVHSDGIALSPDTNWLYYVALSGHTLYRIPTKVLRNNTPKPESYIEKVAKIYAPDGMVFDKNGTLYLAGLETNSVYSVSGKGQYQLVAKDPEIRWADSFAVDGEGNLYFTTSQIHLDENKRGLYKVIMIDRKDL
ncbi:hypothetical protein FUAX_21020 [Fulvitalea axinellae]|uniref:Gluconolactonase n=2 Tax=Fulvitalea axinellae TaxID=1182444 RepID=A0AAU9DFD1_9BACT|nr:hypothetical protein FUAX_21020 [Fulvitalea axinellae]